MPYPEKGAKYRNEPAWMDKAKRAEGGATDSDMAAAKKEIADRTARDTAERSDMTLQEQDREDASDEASRRGDYDSGGTFKPWHPDEDDDIREMNRPLAPIIPD